MRPYTTALNPSGNVEPWRMVQAINQLLKGKSNNVNDVTLTASSATTTLLDPLIGPDSKIGLSSMSATAAAELDLIHFDTPTAGSVVINHPNNALTTRVFRYEVSA